MLGDIRDVDLRLLRVFRTIVRKGGFAGAQVELNVALSTISIQMKQLEERLGVRLCERGNRGFRLTPQGEAAIAAVEELYGAFDDFKKDLSAISAMPVGEVRLGVIDNMMTNPDWRVHEVIAEIHKKIAGLGINILIAQPHDLEGQVLSGTLDMAVGLFSQSYPALNYVHLFREKHELYCAVGHSLFSTPESKITRDALSAADYVSWSYLDAYVSAASTLKLTAKTGTPFMDGVAALILSGRYIGYLPSHFAQSWVTSGRMRSLAKDETSRRVDVLLISRKAQRMKRVISTFYRTLLAAHSNSVAQ